MLCLGSKVAVLLFLLVVGVLQAFHTSSFRRSGSLKCIRLAHSKSLVRTSLTPRTVLNSEQDRLDRRPFSNELLEKGLKVISSSLLALLSLQTKTVLAAQNSAINGWDLYGRVPYDDWLFTTDKLLDPNLLRRSMVESVVAEIPDSLASFQRRRNIKTVFKGIRIAALVIFGFFVTLKVASWGDVWASGDRKREDAIRGFHMPIAANYKPDKRPNEIGPDDDQ